MPKEVDLPLQDLEQQRRSRQPGTSLRVLPPGSQEDRFGRVHSTRRERDREVRLLLEFYNSNFAIGRHRVDLIIGGSKRRHGGTRPKKPHNNHIELTMDGQATSAL